VTNSDAIVTDAADIIDLEVVSQSQALDQATEVVDSYRLPFSFASAQGVMLADAESKVVLHRPV
jgi:hypothetical protein